MKVTLNEEVYARVLNLKPGESMVYHTGLLSFETLDSRVLFRLQKVILALAESKHLHLLQRRVKTAGITRETKVCQPQGKARGNPFEYQHLTGVGTFDYIAVARQRSGSPVRSRPRELVFS